MLENGEIKQLGDIHFYFGIRNQEHDYLFKQELAELFEYFRSANPESTYEIYIAESQPSKFME